MVSPKVRIRAHGGSQLEISSMPAQLISYDQLATKSIPYSKPHLWRLEKAGKFPKRVALGAGRFAYVEAEIDAYIEQKIAERDAKALER